MFIIPGPANERVTPLLSTFYQRDERLFIVLHRVNSLSAVRNTSQDRAFNIVPTAERKF